MRYSTHSLRYVLVALLSLTLVGAMSQSALALIEGGEGNDPIPNERWPKGADPLVNHKARIAYWVGPPFGGGQWHAECRGDTATFNEVLTLFAKLDVKNKKLVVHDGIGRSFWLDPNRRGNQGDAAQVDWVFEVWEEDTWQRLRKLPPDLNPTNKNDAEKGPPSQIDVYAGGKNIVWADVKLPDGLEVVDMRLEAHGFTSEDGNVLEGHVIDLDTKKPLAAKAYLEKIEPQDTGGYKYTRDREVVADDAGHWVMKNGPQGWFQLVIEAEGYVPRIIGYAQFDEQAHWSSYDSGLARPGPVSGRVTDIKDNPLADASVRLDNVVTQSGDSYNSPGGYEAKTDAEGRFQFDQVPIGTAQIWIHKQGYCRIGLGKQVKTPVSDLVMEMLKSASLVVTIDFTNVQRPEAYIVNIEPEGGSEIGSWGGGGQINEQNQIKFSDVPPGRYVLQGRPNPGAENETTEPVTVNLKGGDAQEITIMAK